MKNAKLKVADQEEVRQKYEKLLVGNSLLFGRTLVQAHGKVIRVIRRDGRPSVITDDINPSRINIEIENGVITKVIDLS